MPDLDGIEQMLINEYIYNDKVSRKWLTCQTLRHINDFDKYFIQNKPYFYTWKTALNEYKSAVKISDKEKKNRYMFFNRTVILKMLKDYKNALRFYLNTKLNENTSVKIKRHSPITKDSMSELMYDIDIIENRLETTYNAQNFLKILKNFTEQFPIYVPLPKSDAWKKAFKSQGAYYTLLHLVKFYDLQIDGKNKKASLEILKHIAQTTPEYLFDILQKSVKESEVIISA